jgi:hypothetical protein
VPPLDSAVWMLAAGAFRIVQLETTQLVAPRARTLVLSHSARRDGEIAPVSFKPLTSAWSPSSQIEACV